MQRYRAIPIMALAALPAMAAAQSAKRSSDVSVLAACRQIAQPEARLACFDREFDALAARIDAGSVVVVNKAEARAAQRERFGLATSGNELFKDKAGVSVPSVSAVVASAAQDTYGKWVVTMKDGSRWHQIDDYPIAVSPKPGDPVTITRGAIGSFKLSVARQASVKVRRER